MHAPSTEPNHRTRAIAKGEGRALRFLLAVLLLWAGVRIIAILSGELNSAATGTSPISASGIRPASSPVTIVVAPPGLPGDEAPAMQSSPLRDVGRPPIVGMRAPPQPGTTGRQVVTTTATPPLSPPVASAAASRASISVPASPPIAPDVEKPSGSRQRWSGSAWLLWRDAGATRAIGSAGQLGGAQAGLRIDRHLGRPVASIPAAAYARLTTALHEPAAPELALGLAIYPVSGRVPVMIGIERRVKLDEDGRNAFSILAATGLNPTRITGRLIAEGYAQAGMVGFSRKDLFADGRATVTMPLDRKGTTGIGLGVSGGAQPAVSRLDIGPLFQIRLPLGAVSPRLSVEWRQRVAGNARPGSGAAIILASDF